MIQRLLQPTSLIIGVLVAMGVAACGSDDDNTSPGGTGGGTGGTAGNAGAGASAGGAGSAGASASGGTGGASGSAGAAGVAGSAGAAGASTTFAVLVRGTLFTTDMTEAQNAHDPLAAGGEAAATSAGDIAHDVLLGTPQLGGAENAFLALDRWTNEQGMDAFYANPDFQAGFATLFAEPPTFEQFVHRPTWASWGDLSSGDGYDPYYFAVVRGRLAETDPTAAQAGHDAVAGAGQAAANAAGDVAHVVFTGRQDPQEFMAIDVWRSADNIEVFYGNPDFKAAFGALFETDPSLAIYRSTDWHQW